jgi:hypothetical protein
MKNRLLVVLFVAGAVISLQAQTKQEMPKKDSTRKTVSKESFIRMDLLRKEKKPLPPAPRSIFTAKRPGYSDMDQVGLQENIERIEEAGGIRREGSEDFYIDLRYMGYVRSGTKIVALVIFQGEALAVAEGEMIAEGITVNKIGLEEIEVIGPDAKTSTFLLEGELP